MGDVAGVEIVGAGCCEALQGVGETAERQVHRVAFGRADRWQAVGQPDLPALVIETQFRCRIGDLDRGEPVDRQALARQCRGRRRQLAPRHMAKTLDRHRIAAHRARDRKGERPVDVAVARDLRPGEQLGLGRAGQRISGRVEPAGGDRAEIDGLGMLGAGAMHDHEADAAEPAVPRLDRRQSECRGDRGIDGAAARGQHLGADRGGGAALRGDDAALRGRARLGDLPVLGQVHGAGVLNRR